MLDAIYNQRIMELAADIPHVGRLDGAHGSATAHARLCGSSVTVDVRLDGEGRVAAFGHVVKACLLGQAAASIMARHAVGMDAAAIEALRGEMRAMLREGGPPPGGAHADFAVLEPVRDYRARHASTLLTFDALAEAVAVALGAAPVPQRAVA